MFHRAGDGVRCDTQPGPVVLRHGVADMQPTPTSLQLGGDGDDVSTGRIGGQSGEVTGPVGMGGDPRRSAIQKAEQAPGIGGGQGLQFIGHDPTLPSDSGKTFREDSALSGQRVARVDYYGADRNRPRKNRYPMSGHSKWATTKHKKAANDAKRGKEFAKLIKNIEVAARTGGGDPSANPTLDDMIKKAKKASVPNTNIESARKRGSGEETGGADWETIVYEGYGPNGVAMLVECLTDNRNRATTDVRTAMNKNGGSLADAGSVSYLFNRKGVVILDKGENTEDDLLMAVLDAGAEEVNDLGEKFEVVSDLADLTKVRAALADAGIEYDSADPDYRADVEVPLDADGAKKILRLIDALEESDDVQDVFTNMDVSDEVLAELDAE